MNDNQDFEKIQAQNCTNEELTDIFDRVMSDGLNVKSGRTDGLAMAIKSKTGCPVFFDEHLSRCRRFGFYTWAEDVTEDGKAVGISLDLPYREVGPDVMRDKADAIMKILTERYRGK